MPPPPKLPKSIPLPAGGHVHPQTPRTLSYSEYGSPSGYPMIYLHGFPSSRLEPSGPIDVMARRNNIRLLAPDRAGFGFSSPYGKKTTTTKIIDYSRDIFTLADSLKLERFSVLGCSGGGPFAVGCLAGEQQLQMEKEKKEGKKRGGSRRITGVGLFASGPHWGDLEGAKEMGRFRRMFGWASQRKLPAWGMKVFVGALVWTVKKVVNWGFVARWIDGWIEEQGRRSRELKKGDEEGNEKKGGMDDGLEGEGEEGRKRSAAEKRMELVSLLCDEPFRQGAGPMVEEARLLSSTEWGFRLEDLDESGSLVRIYHGEEDKNAPLGMIRWMAERLPRAELRVLEGHSHYTAFYYMEDLMKELVADQIRDSAGEEKEEGANGDKSA